jgi:hypothetical protein
MTVPGIGPITAQAMRAILLANATVATDLMGVGGFRRVRKFAWTVNSGR